MTSDSKEYIGDGVYAAFDGFALILTTENGIEVTNTVVIEPREWATLTMYVQLKRRLHLNKAGAELDAMEALKEEQARGEVRRCSEGCGGHVAAVDQPL